MDADHTDRPRHASSNATAPAEGPIEVGRAIEAVLLVATDPTPVHLLAQLLEAPAEVVEERCRRLAAIYETDGRGFQLVEVAGGWRFQTHPDLHPYVERYALEGIPNRLSGAALETLAIVAYKQPISRARISAIRGVNVDAVLRTLIQHGYVEERGRDAGPGQAVLFGTTGFFLERLGLASLDDLPPLGDFVPSAQVLEALEQTLRIDGATSGAPEADPAVEGDGDVAVDATDGPAPNGSVPSAIDLRPQTVSGAPPTPNGNGSTIDHAETAPGSPPDG